MKSKESYSRRYTEEEDSLLAWWNKVIIAFHIELAIPVPKFPAELALVL